MMRAFTVATHYEGFLYSLEDSARKYGYQLSILGLHGEWKGFVWRWKMLNEALQSVPGEELVLVLDGYDTVITAPAACLAASLLMNGTRRRTASPLPRARPHRCRPRPHAAARTSRTRRSAAAPS